MKQCVPDLLNELRQRERNRNNWMNPDKAIQVGGTTANYLSGQLSSSRCNCRINFGGEGKKGKSHVVVDCNQLKVGQTYESILTEAMKANARKMDGEEPVWLRKAFHALLNENSHKDGHGIDAHSISRAAFAKSNRSLDRSWHPSARPAKNNVPTCTPTKRIGRRRLLLTRCRPDADDKDF